MDDGYQPITEEEELAAVRAQARRVVRRSVAATLVAALVMALLQLGS